MMDIRKRFNMALKDTVDEWKQQENVIGLFVHGSYVRGTITANSDLDICIIWNTPEAPAPLLAEHKGVRVDMTFLTQTEIEEVIENRTDDDFRIAEVIERLRGAEVVHDTDDAVKNWEESASKYLWPDNVIANVKQRAMEYLDSASYYAEIEDVIASVHQVRRALFELGRVVQMRNNLFHTTRPAEILTEIRLLDPITYKLFLRTFKLKGMGEDELLEILSYVDQWLKIAEDRFGDGVAHDSAVGLLNQAQRYYHGALGLTYNGDYELAVLEMRRSIDQLGAALLALGGVPNMNPGTFIPELRENESEFFGSVLEEYGAFDYQPKGIERSIAEARFIAQNL